MKSKKKKDDAGTSTAPWTIRVRWRIERVLGIFIFWLARRLTRKSALKLADFFGGVLFRCFKRYRNVCIDGLTIAFGDSYTDKEKYELARQSQLNLVRTVMEFLRFGTYTKDELLSFTTEVKGLEHLERAIERSTGGVLGLAAHLGSWEYCGAWCVASGRPVSAVGKDQRDPGITKIMLNARTAAGIKHIPKSKRGNLALVRTLKTKGSMLGLLSDQNGGKNGIFIDFFGVQASSVRGPAFLARKYNVPVLPMFALWDGDNYRIEILPEVEVTVTDNEKKDEIVNTQRFMKVIEDMVRKYPGQWLWAHRRWKTRPPGEPPIHKH